MGLLLLIILIVLVVVFMRRAGRGQAVVRGGTGQAERAAGGRQVRPVPAARAEARQAEADREGASAGTQMRGKTDPQAAASHGETAAPYDRRG